MTSYSDERDGALDAEKKQRFLEMLRESFRRGGREMTFLITHTQDLWSQVSQRIHLHPENHTIEIVN